MIQSHFLTQINQVFFRSQLRKVFITKLKIIYGDPGSHGWQYWSSSQVFLVLFTEFLQSKSCLVDRIIPRKPFRLYRTATMLPQTFVERRILTYAFYRWPYSYRLCFVRLKILCQRITFPVDYSTNTYHIGCHSYIPSRM